MRIILHSLGVLMLALVPLRAAGNSPVAAGAPAVVAVDKPEVLAAAKFAVEARAKQVAADAKLELVKVLEAKEQVVAGISYRLKLKVKQNGQEKSAGVVVWWQSWRKPDPYQLTRWTWE